MSISHEKGVIAENNEEEVQKFIDEMLDRYTKERFQHWSLDRLHNFEYKIENEFMMFECDFPPEGGLSGPWRGYLYDDPEEEKYPLSSSEKRKLRQAKLEIENRIYQAKGPKIEDYNQRKHTTLSQILSLLSEIIKKI